MNRHWKVLHRRTRNPHHSELHILENPGNHVHKSCSGSIPRRLDELGHRRGEDGSLVCAPVLPSLMHLSPLIFFCFNSYVSLVDLLTYLEAHFGQLLILKLNIEAPSPRTEHRHCFYSARSQDTAALKRPGV